MSRLPSARQGPCAVCAGPGEVHLAATPLCKWCWRALTEREQQRTCAVCGATWVGSRDPTGEACWWCERREEARAEAMDNPIATFDDARLQRVWCPTHRRSWTGFVGEVHGGHDNEHWTCNARGVPL